MSFPPLLSFQMNVLLNVLICFATESHHFAERKLRVFHVDYSFQFVRF